MDNRPSVFISYNWNSDSLATNIENRLCPFANVHRDKSSIKEWQSLVDFMKTIRINDFAVLIISDDYLKSEACMYEVTQLMKEEKWFDYSMFVVEDSAKVIYNVTKQLDYVEYWNNKYLELANKLKNFDSTTVIYQTKELKKIEEIKLNIGEFVDKIAKLNNPKVEDVIEKIVDRVNQGGSYKVNNLIDNSNKPIFDIKILDINKKIRGIAEIVDNPFNSRQVYRSQHKNVQLSIELVNDIVIRDVFMFNKLIDTIMKPKNIYYMTIAYEDSPDTRYTKYVTILKYEDYKDENGIPLEILVKYKDSLGEDEIQHFQLKCNNDQFYYTVES